MHTAKIAVDAFLYGAYCKDHNAITPTIQIQANDEYNTATDNNYKKKTGVP